MSAKWSLRRNHCWGAAAHNSILYPVTDRGRGHRYSCPNADKYVMPKMLCWFRESSIFLIQTQIVPSKMSTMIINHRLYMRKAEYETEKSLTKSLS